jgi:thiosulfate reductase cytochrome b subunit
MMEKFWTMQRRAWAYSVMVALVPLLVAIGLLTNETAGLVLNVIAAVLAVGGGSMALSNLTPDNVFKMGVKLPDDGA